MARFRLRFLLQELDLVGPEVVIGRSPDCQITIEDPLVSRQHARILIGPEGAKVSDLGSRNGVRVNGNLIQEETILKDQDRVRLGTQELVFLTLDENATGLARATGFMYQCRGCGKPFPEGTPACPHCGTVVPVTEDGDDSDYDTVTGITAEPRPNWTFTLLAEVIERALSAGRGVEAERMFGRAAQEVDERVTVGERIEPEHLSMLGVFAVRLSRLLGSSGWAEWALTLHREQGVMPSEDVLDQLEALEWSEFPTLLPLAQGILLWWGAKRAAEADGDEKQRHARFEAVCSRAGT